MLRKVSISWYKQRSGSYALKGITITEDDHSYDSSTTFRDADAEWVTTSLNAEADVEVARTRGQEWNKDGYPEWAERKREASLVEANTPLALERANATLIRHFLSEIIKTTNNNVDTEEGKLKLQKLIQDANTLLRTTSSGTYYTVDEALAMLSKPENKPRATKSRT
jgi:hypothetical protein